MKKALLLVIAYFGIFFLPGVSAQNWQWARSGTCSSHLGGSEGWLVRTDKGNNVFMTGFYYGDSICIGNTTFHNPVNPTNNTQTLIVKYDTAGNVLWTRAGSNGQSRPIAITVDKSDNLYVFGYFTKDSIRFGTQKLINPNFDHLNPEFNYCYYLLKYSAAGDLVWARNGTTNINPAGDYLHPGGVTSDVAGNIYIASMFNKSTLAFGSDTLYNAGGTNGTNEIFIAKYDTAGSIVWSRSFAGAKDDYVFDITCSNDYRLYFTGYFKSGYIQFGTTKLFTSNKRSYLVSIDTAGNVLWAKGAGSKAIARAVATDAGNNIYTVGGFVDSVTFDNSNIFYNANGGYFLLKYDNSGTITRAKVFLPTVQMVSCCDVYSMTTDHCDNVWLSINMEPGKGIGLDSATTVFPPAGSVDPTFFAGFNSAGALLGYAALPSGGGYNSGLSNSGLAADGKGNIFFTGDYRAVDPFIVGKDTLHLYNGQQTNIFIGKYRPADGCDSVAPPVYPAVPIITIYPSPGSDICVLDYYGDLGTGAQAAVRDITGRLVRTFPVTTQLTPFPVSDLADGMYMCTIKVQGRALYAIRFVVLK